MAKYGDPYSEFVTQVSPEVHHNLLCLPHIEGQVVSTTPFSQLCHFLSVVRFILVADETYHWCVIASVNLMMWLELNLAVQSWVSSVESSGLNTQSCGAPVLSVVVLEVLRPTRTDWGLPVRKSRIQLQRELLRPSRFNLLMSCCGIMFLNAELKSMNGILTYHTTIYIYIYIKCIVIIYNIVRSFTPTGVSLVSHTLTHTHTCW